MHKIIYCLLIFAFGNVELLWLHPRRIRWARSIIAAKPYGCGQL